MRCLVMVWRIHVVYPVEQKTANIYGVDGSVVEEYRLPLVFSLPIRIDLIRRAFLAAFTARLQPQGRDPLAGKRTTARSWGVGRGMARVPRLPNGTAAFISFARGGHAAFPPRTDRKIHERINKKERAYAIASALAATASPDHVRRRGHAFTAKSLPLIITDEVEEKVGKARDAREFLEKIGIWGDVARAAARTRIRSGKGKMRGRRYKEPRSILFVLTSKKAPLALAVRNMPGVDIATPADLSILHLAPGGVPGRLTVFSKSALEEIAAKYEVIHI